MAENDDEMSQRLEELNSRNKKLIKQIQKLKITIAEKDNEKLKVMRENNELRLKLSKIRTGAAADANKLDAALQSNSEEALTHLVQASNAVTRNMELMKMYIRDRKEREAYTLWQSNISFTPTRDKVHRVPPMMLGGQSIQPVVALSRTLNSSLNSSMSRPTSQTQPRTERAVPMHVLQDVYIPLTRLSLSDVLGNSAGGGGDNNADDTIEESDLEDSGEEENNMSDENDQDISRGLETVDEELETEQVTPARSRNENPLEGPSWLLDGPEPTGSARVRSEPDSTTQPEESSPVLQLRVPAPQTLACTTPLSAPSPGPSPSPSPSPLLAAPRLRLAKPTLRTPAELQNEGVSVFSPTVRRRKRNSSPVRPASFSPRHSIRNNRVDRELKVLLAKISVERYVESPPKRARVEPPPFDAPSPNGATDARLIVSDSSQEQLDVSDRIVSRRASKHSVRSRHSRDEDRNSRRASRDSHTPSLDGQRNGPSGSRDKNTSQVTRREQIIESKTRESTSSDDSTPLKRESLVNHVHSDNANNNSPLENSPNDMDIERERHTLCGSPLANSSVIEDNSRPPRDSRRTRRDTARGRRPYGDSRSVSRDSSTDSRDRKQKRRVEVKQEIKTESQEDSETDSGDLTSRTRRPRKAVIYKEMPLNRKMRR